ncbi:MAG: hypothetical protein K8I27_13045 [Planctomycetes bacterium]|nr:hypothetical protein [Planctomycetota bacterium]
MADEDCPSCNDHTFPRAMHLKPGEVADMNNLLASVETRPFNPGEYYARADNELIFEDDDAVGVGSVSDGPFAPQRASENQQPGTAPARQFVMDQDGRLLTPPSSEVTPQSEGTAYMREAPAISADDYIPQSNQFFMDEDPAVEGDSVGACLPKHLLDDGSLAQTNQDLFGSEGLGQHISALQSAHVEIVGRVTGQAVATTQATTLRGLRRMYQPGIGGLIDKQSIKLSCDEFTFRWFYWLLNPQLWALGYRVFQTVYILQTFECCDGYVTNYVYGYIEVFREPVGADRHSSDKLESTGKSICRDDPCDSLNHEGLKRVTESRVIRTFLARPTSLALQALTVAPTAFVELSGQLKQQGVGDLNAVPIPDCVRYWSQRAVPGEFARLPGPVPGTSAIIADIAQPQTALQGSERDAGITFTAEFDCTTPRNPCIDARLAITSKLDRSFRAACTWSPKKGLVC